MTFGGEDDVNFIASLKLCIEVARFLIIIGGDEEAFPLPDSAVKVEVREKAWLLTSKESFDANSMGSAEQPTITHRESPMLPHMTR
mmetsp:Transcript_18348/g.26464  ORF Transcript_18348/g.26464 Transcript_18348/m.26464 type:complete len:86 (-) Transcript_18348:610-867(-)